MRLKKKTLKKKNLVFQFYHMTASWNVKLTHQAHSGHFIPNLMIEEMLTTPCLFHLKSSNGTSTQVKSLIVHQTTIHQDTPQHPKVIPLILKGTGLSDSINYQKIISYQSDHHTLNQWT